MSLARALTKRMGRSDGPNRSGTIRNQISGPVALLSTTNMLSYEAPDIATLNFPGTDTSSNASTTPSTPTRHSEDDSDTLPSVTPITEPSSAEVSPVGDHKYLASYFTPANPPTTSIRKAAEVEDIPSVPSRAPSHSKREHERLARKRSLQHIRPASQTNSLTTTSPHASRTSTELAHTSIPGAARHSATSKSADNPFSAELAQLHEVAEEFGQVARAAAIDDDLAVMRARGLRSYAAADYLSEIQPLWLMAFDEAEWV